MKKIDDLYFVKFEQDNITYSLDKIRLKTYVEPSVYNDLDFYLRCYYSKNVTKFWISDRIMQFHYNWKIDVEEGRSLYIGFRHNNETKDDYHGKFNLTIEFNPNKIQLHPLVLHVLDLSGDWYIKSYDVAFDLKVNILDLIYDMTGRQIEKIDNRGYDDKTIYLGKEDGRIKIYNKKIESDLGIVGELTRVEISRQVEDFRICDIKLFQYDNIFPHIYLKNYIYSLSDYKDKTLLALLYAVQNGFPLRDLTKTYRKKIKDLFEGGYKIKFSRKLVTDLVRQTVFKYFVRSKAIQIFK